MFSSFENISNMTQNRLICIEKKKLSHRINKPSTEIFPEAKTLYYPVCMTPSSRA